MAVNLHWGHVCIEKDLEELTGLKVKAGNDANVAALGELWKGGASGRRSLIMVTLGTGVGGGIIVNEKVIAGAHGPEGRLDTYMWRIRLRIPATAATADAWSKWHRNGNCPSRQGGAGEEPGAFSLTGRHISAKAVFERGKRRRRSGRPGGGTVWTVPGKGIVHLCVSGGSTGDCNRGRRVQAGPILLDFIVKTLKSMRSHPARRQNSSWQSWEMTPGFTERPSWCCNDCGMHRKVPYRHRDKRKTAFCP